MKLETLEKAIILRNEINEHNEFLDALKNECGIRFFVDISAKFRAVPCSIQLQLREIATGLLMAHKENLQSELESL